MAHFDVFNGDADGICALHQLRLAQPRDATLVTGVKRDIALLARVPAQRGDSVTVLDVSLERNRGALAALLARGVEVEYFDHHHPGELLHDPRLHLTIATAPDTCTSLLVDRHLAGAHRAWAVVGAFGDNVTAAALALARELGLAPAAVDALHRLGDAMNYNAYGDTVDDLLLAPDRLYQRVRPYADPLAFIAGERIAAELLVRRSEDLASAGAQAMRLAPGAWLLPDTAWARRVLGPFANVLAQREPQQAHAVLRATPAGDYVVSVRAPRVGQHGADALCRRFGGSGRAAAGGIDHLPAGEVQAFLAAFTQAFPRQG